MSGGGQNFDQQIFLRSRTHGSVGSALGLSRNGGHQWLSAWSKRKERRVTAGEDSRSNGVLPRLELRGHNRRLHGVFETLAGDFEHHFARSLGEVLWEMQSPVLYLRPAAQEFLAQFLQTRVDVTLKELLSTGGNCLGTHVSRRG
jgi:hypothetical protein